MEKELREVLRCSCRTRRQWQWKTVTPLHYHSLQRGENLSAPNQWDPFNIQSQWLPQCQAPPWFNQLRPCLFVEGHGVITEWVDQFSEATYSILFFFPTKRNGS